jgi:hypothetical protein
MEKIIELNVGEAGLRFVEETLTGWGGLATRAAQLPIRQGQVVALVPEGTSLKRATSFHEGGLVRISSTDGVLVRDILSRRHQGSSMVVQDTLNPPTSKYVVDYRDEDLKFFYDSVVYWFINGEEFDEQSLMGTIQLAYGFHTLVFVLSCPVDEKRFLNREVSATVISDFVDHIEEIAISAYDQESFVIWRPGP